MNHIKEYHIFSFLKRKKKNSPIKLDWICDFEKDLLYSSSDLEKYSHYTDRESNFTSGNIISLNDPPYEKDGYLTVSYTGRVSISRFKADNKYERGYNIDTTAMDKSLRQNGFFNGAIVYIPDLNINARIVQIKTGLISRYNFDVGDGKIMKVLKLIDVKGKEHYRTPKQVTIVKTDKLHIESEVELEIEDYLLDLIDSGKFIIKIDQIKNDGEISNFCVSIGFKDGLDKELETISRFFSNINQLRKRLNGIGMDIEVSDINKTSVKLLVYKLPIKENFYIKRYDEAFFWNKHKDDDIGDMIFKKLDTLKSSDISHPIMQTKDGDRPNNKRFSFNIEGFEIVSGYTTAISEWGHPNITGYFITADGVELDISDKKGKKIFDRLSDIYREEKDKNGTKMDVQSLPKIHGKEDVNHIKKDLRISLRENMSKGECDICGESIYTDDRICDDCKMNKDEIEFDDTTTHLEEPPQTLPAYPMSQNIYFEKSDSKNNLSQLEIDYISDIFIMEVVDKLYLKQVNEKEFLETYEMIRQGDFLNLRDSDPCYYEEYGGTAINFRDKNFIRISFLHPDIGDDIIKRFKNRIGNEYTVKCHEFNFKLPGGKIYWMYRYLEVTKILLEKPNNEIFENETFKEISYDNFEDWVEGRKVEEFNDFEDNYIRKIFNNVSFEYELDSEEKGIINMVIYEEKYSQDGVGIRITKYNDEYFHVLIEDVCKDSNPLGGETDSCLDNWITPAFSDGGKDAICDQVQGVVDFIKYELRDSYFKPSSADWRRKHLK